MAKDQLVKMGLITGAHGVRGAVRIQSFTQPPQNLFAYGSLRNDRGEQKFMIQKWKSGTRCFIADLEDCKDRDAAQSLAGAYLYLHRSELPTPAPDEFYHTDLIRLCVKEPDGTLLGKVKSVENFGAEDLLEIIPENIAAGTSFYLPFTREIIPNIDLKEGVLILSDAAKPYLPGETDAEAD